MVFRLDAVRGGDFLGRRLERGLGPGHQMHAAALGRQPLGHGQADALGRPGDQRRASLQIQIHLRLRAANSWSDPII